MRTVCNHHKAMRCHFGNGLTQNVTSPMLSWWCWPMAKIWTTDIV